MPRKMLTEWPICKAILDGEHDADLRVMEQAIAHRRKMLDRAIGAAPGCRFTFVDGRVGTITKVNPKRYNVIFDGDGHAEYAVAKGACTVEPTERAARIGFLAAHSLNEKGEYDFSRSIPIGCSKGGLKNGATCACPECEASR